MILYMYEEVSQIIHETNYFAMILENEFTYLGNRSMEFLDKSSVVRGRPQESSSLEEANPSSETSRREFPVRLRDPSPGSNCIK